MNILADIVMFEPTVGNIVIDGLTYFIVFTAEDLGTLPLILTSDPARVILYVYIKGTGLSKMVLRATMDKNIHTRFYIRPNQVAPSNLVLKEEPCRVVLILPPLKLETSQMVLKNNVVRVIMNSIFRPISPDKLIMQCSEIDTLHKIVYLYPKQAELHRLDFKYLWEMDPYLLNALDYYGIGTRLMTTAKANLTVRGHGKDSQAVMKTTLNVRRGKIIDKTAESKTYLKGDTLKLRIRVLAKVFEVDGENDDYTFELLDSYTINGVDYKDFIELEEE